MFSTIFLIPLVVLPLCCSEELVHQLAALEQQIQYHEGVDLILAASRPCIESSQNPSVSLPLVQSEPESLQLTALPLEEFSVQCQILSQFPMGSLLSFQTPRQVYVLANSGDGGEANCSIYNTQCELISVIKGKIVQSICDRKNCDHGMALFFSAANEIIQCNEANNFTQCTYSSVPLPQRPLLGSITRSKGMGNYEAYFAHSSGITVYNVGDSRSRLVVPMEIGSQIIQFEDRHPQALVLSDLGWLYSLDATHFSLSLIKCPYVGSPVRLHVPSAYSQFVYALTTNAVFKFELKPQANTCSISQTAFLSHPIDLEASQKITDYHGYLFVGTQVVNIDTGVVTQFLACGSASNLQFQPLKNSFRKGAYFLKCCERMQDKEICGVAIFSASQTDDISSSKGQFIAITLVLGIFLALIYYFVKPMPANVDESDPEFSNTQNQAYRVEVEKMLAKASKKGREGRQANANGA